MKRPAFQFYADKWMGNAKLRRCTPSARGTWIDMLCLLHDSDEYGVLRWPLIDIANALGSIKLLRELVDKGVLKGSDKDCKAFIYVPRHAGKDGEPVTLIEANNGPCWYSSRMVRDEYLRQNAGLSTRFKPRPGGSDPPPSRRQGVRQGDEPGQGNGVRSGDAPRHGEGVGSVFVVSLDKSGFNNTTVGPVDNSTPGAINAPKVNGQTVTRLRGVEQKILERGKAAGLAPRPGESFDDFDARIQRSKHQGAA